MWQALVEWLPERGGPRIRLVIARSRSLEHKDRCVGEQHQLLRSQRDNEAGSVRVSESV